MQKDRKILAIFITLLIVFLPLLNGCSSFGKDSENLLSGKFKVDGKVYNMPMKADKLDNGDWAFEDDDDSWDCLVNSHEEHSLSLYLKSDPNVLLYIVVYNLSDKEKKAIDCMVTHAEIECDPRFEAEVYLPHEIQLGKTTYSEAKELVKSYVAECEYGEIMVYMDGTMADRDDETLCMDFEKKLCDFWYDFSYMYEQ